MYAIDDDTQLLGAHLEGLNVPERHAVSGGAYQEAK